MLVLLWLGILVSDCFSKLFTKKNSQTFSVGGISGALIFTVETSLLSLLFFWMFNGFSLSVTSKTCLYAFFYSIPVILCVVIAIFVYKFGSFAFISFTRSTLALIASMLLGRFAFGEAISAEKILRVAFLMLATSILFYSNLKKAKCKSLDDASKNCFFHPIGVMLTVALAIVGCFSTFILKSFSSIESGAGDSNSFLFMTNLFSAGIGLAILLFFVCIRHVRVGDVKRMVINKSFFNSLFTTLNSNAASLMSLKLVAMMDVAIHTTMSSALGFIAVALVSPIIKEKLDRYTIIATTAAVLSVVVPALIW